MFVVVEVLNKDDLLNRTKRAVVGVISSFYDPIGILLPVVTVLLSRVG